MIFGAAAWGLRELPLEEQMNITKRMGLCELEVGIANAPKDIPLDVSDDELERIRRMAEVRGISLSCAATGNDFTEGTADVAKVKRVVMICRKLGIGYLRIFAGFLEYEKITELIFSKMISALKEVIEFAREQNVVLVMETHGAVQEYLDGIRHLPSITTDAKSLHRILSQVPDSLMLCFDPANLYAVGNSHPEIIYREFYNRIAYIHLKDFKKTPEGAIAPTYCGESDMDWDSLMKEIQDFNGRVFFEYEITTDVAIGMAKSYQFVKERLQCLESVEV